LAKPVVTASLSGRQAKAKAELKGERLLVPGLDIVG